MTALPSLILRAAFALECGGDPPAPWTDVDTGRRRTISRDGGGMVQAGPARRGWGWWLGDGYPGHRAASAMSAIRACNRAIDPTDAGAIADAVGWGWTESTYRQHEAEGRPVRPCWDLVGAAGIYVVTVWQESDGTWMYAMMRHGRSMFRRPAKTAAEAIDAAEAALARAEMGD